MYTLICKSAATLNSGSGFRKNTIFLEHPVCIMLTFFTEDGNVPKNSTDVVTISSSVKIRLE